MPCCTRRRSSAPWTARSPPATTRRWRSTFPGVGKVRATATNWNTVTLFVAPAGGGPVSDVLRANLLAYFEDKRPVSTRIEIAEVDYVADPRDGGDRGAAVLLDARRPSSRSAPATGALLAFDNVDFATPIYLSRFYEVIEAIDGVEFANITEFRRADRARRPVGPGDHGRSVGQARRSGRTRSPSRPRPPATAAASRSSSWTGATDAAPRHRRDSASRRQPRRRQLDAAGVAGVPARARRAARGHAPDRPQPGLGRRGDRRARAHGPDVRGRHGPAGRDGLLLQPVPVRDDRGRGRPSSCRTRRSRSTASIGPRRWRPRRSGWRTRCTRSCR